MFCFNSLLGIRPTIDNTVVDCEARGKGAGSIDRKSTRPIIVILLHIIV